MIFPRYLAILYVLGVSPNGTLLHKRSDVVKTVESYMEQHHMIKENDVIVAGVSGGADSVCLFSILKDYCAKKGATLVVVHMNHGIRKDASEDASFVEALCKAAGIEYHLFCEDIPTYAKQRGIGTEEAGRMARYEAFETIRTSFGNRGKIAVAHNRNDQAETTLFHLFRGSGVAGLSGIMPVREHIIRPLLCVERKEIENYLTQKGIKWCIDSTNKENTYTRNKLRNVVFPYVEKEICEQSIRHVANAAEELSQVRLFLEELTLEAEKAVLKKEKEEVCIRREEFLKQHEVIRKQLVLRALSHLVPSRKDFTSFHVKDILSLFEKHSGKQIQLPYGLCAVREFDKIAIRKSVWKAEGQAALPVTVPGQVICPDGTIVEFSLLPADKNRVIPQKTYTKWFDYGKIEHSLMIRNRQSGDYLTITEGGGRKKIKEYFIEEKIPRLERENKLLLADDKHILWVIGMRISEAYKVTEETETILQVAIKHTEEERSYYG